MEVLRTVSELKNKLCERKSNLELGFVPTMGAIHAGHLSLIAASKQANDLTICSIFVNPTQFNNARDLEIYPRPIEQDVSLLAASQVDYLFLPSEKEIYPHREKWEIELDGLDRILEGKSRPGHFQGVCQVVNRLFSLVRPNRAYFGQKDFQQLLVIRKMVSLLKLPVEIYHCPIVREADGLAMSSRNIHLKGLVREEASFISKTLFAALEDSRDFDVIETKKRSIERLNQGRHLKTDYFCIANALTLEEIRSWDDCESVIALAAVQAGNTRLIDNQFLRPLTF